MRFAIALSSLMLTLSAPVESAQSGSHERGATLHAGNCVRCHDSSVYTREQRRVSSKNALGKQVRRCRDNLGLTWFDEDTDSVIDFLNAEYYRF